MTRRQLTDEEWEYVEPYLPVGEYGPYPTKLREQFEGVIWKFRAGAQWREMPAEFGAWPPCTTGSASGGTPGSSRTCWRA